MVFSLSSCDMLLYYVFLLRGNQQDAYIVLLFYFTYSVTVSAFCEAIFNGELVLMLIYF